MFETKPPKGRIFTLGTLRDKGVPFSKNHIRRLVRMGRFPKPFRLSERRPAWTEAQLDAWVSAREAERDLEYQLDRDRDEANRLAREDS